MTPDHPQMWCYHISYNTKHRITLTIARYILRFKHGVAMKAKTSSPKAHLFVGETLLVG
jgi:hypothetical protein